ncbi:MAG: hypothetical protein D3907_11280 [Candidatus Electrothrix sp. AUS3]|nr:hypothetical protein [Candidatus Electrothrix gigas]
MQKKLLYHKKKQRKIIRRVAVPLAAVFCCGIGSADAFTDPPSPPSLDTLDKLNQHCISIGFPLMTVGMLFGYLWAHQIWGGRPWQWNPKIVSAIITWLLYAGLMHQRFTLGWRGRRAAWITVVAFCAVLLTFWFVIKRGA